MASYSHFLGRKVTVQYRAGDILVPASGTFVADSGRSIFLEQHIEQRGRRNYFRWEIPYVYLYRIEEVSELQAQAAAEPAPEHPERLAAAAAQAPSDSHSILRLPRRPKTA
ncbi:MAG TPA: hypothetical protein VN830_08480 [Verrucomicrobiae bacterium]|nr:hypothetical protein [Verrucomicrobiae bacterium]